ncbi:hypothetical protein ABG768_017711 [Culter alburnus]|uniref:Ubiquitin-like domain-containing protein n=1 Tax=Culter alburnus TaxID=194366 RepID=A0AAW1YUZ0_CULAL
MSFQIYFRDEINKRERMKVCVSSSEEELRNTTVEELKRKLIPEDQLDDAELLYKDETLKKNRTLGFYGIKHEDEIIAVRRGSSLCLCKRRYPEDEGDEQSLPLYEEVKEIIPRTRSMDNMLLDMQQPQ